MPNSPSRCPIKPFELGDHRAARRVFPRPVNARHEAKASGAPAITIWGSGRRRRQFLHVDDLVDACVFLMQRYSDESRVRVGSGEDIAIADLERLVCEVVGFNVAIRHDRTKPDGTPRKLMSRARLAALGWQPRIALHDGIVTAYQDYLQTLAVRAEAA